MYRNCIYCSADLGENQVLETFPVGRGIAFDAALGRLWAVCPKCGRWNLSPLEERWEPVEAAERAFRDARLRVQSEKIGLARLPDGTRLIRVGDALQGELAAWRYGDLLLRRRKRYLLVTGAAVAAGAVVAGGLAAASAAGAIGGMINSASMLFRRWHGQKVFAHLPAAPGGRSAMLLRRWHLRQARLLSDGSGGISLAIPHAGRKDPPRSDWRRDRDDPDPLVLPDAEARSVLSRGSVVINSRGADRKRLTEALDLLSRAGSADDFIRRLASTPRTLTRENYSGMRRGRRGRWGTPDGPTIVMGDPDRLALEMALHEAQERAALEGELSVLEAAWREAEEIARIADRLALPAAQEG